MFLYETNQNPDVGKSACTIGQLSKGLILFFPRTTSTSFSCFPSNPLISILLTMGMLQRLSHCAISAALRAYPARQVRAGWGGIVVEAPEGNTKSHPISRVLLLLLLSHLLLLLFLRLGSAVYTWENTPPFQKAKGPTSSITDRPRTGWTGNTEVRGDWEAHAHRAQWSITLIF